MGRTAGPKKNILAGIKSGFKPLPPHKVVFFVFSKSYSRGGAGGEGGYILGHPHSRGVKTLGCEKQGVKNMLF